MKESLAAPLMDPIADDFELKTLTLAGNYRTALVGEFADPLRGHVLEVGAGIGQITEYLVKNPRITKLVSIEPHPAFCAELREKFPGLALVDGTVDDLPADENWDAVISFNVLEHIEPDEVELKKYHDRLLKNSGTLCLFVPARPEIYAELDRDFGHFRRYTRRELRQKLERAGFRIQRLHYYNIVGYAAWWLFFRQLKRRHFNPGSVRFFDRYIFPLVHGFESRLCRPFIGQSLLVTAIAV
jgi:SAM-dependent methyltransferase